MIDPTAIVEDGATIHEDVTVGAFCYIAKDVTLSRGVRIASHCKIVGRVYVGEDVQIFSHALIGTLNSNITIGRGTYIREFVQIGLDGGCAPITLDQEVFVMAYVQLFSGVSLGNNTVLTNAVTMHTNSSCEERVIVGGLSSIDEDVTIGTGVMVGGASQIKDSIPPFTLVEGNPAQIKGLNSIGIRRRFDPQTSYALKNSYKEIYKDGTVDKKKAQQIEREASNNNVKRFARFVLEHC